MEKQNKIQNITKDNSETKVDNQYFDHQSSIDLKFPNQNIHDKYGTLEDS